MIPKGALWRLIIAAVVVLVLWWIVPSILALIVIIAPPAAAAMGPVASIIRALLMLWGLIYVFTGRGGPVIPVA